MYVEQGAARGAPDSGPGLERIEVGQGSGRRRIIRLVLGPAGRRQAGAWAPRAGPALRYLTAVSSRAPERTVNTRTGAAGQPKVPKDAWGGRGPGQAQRRDDGCQPRSANLLTGNNRMSVQAGMEYVRKLGLPVIHGKITYDLTTSSYKF